MFFSAFAQWDIHMVVDAPIQNTQVEGISYGISRQI